LWRAAHAAATERAPAPEPRRKKHKEKEDTRGALREAKKSLRPRFRIVRLDRDAWGPEDAHLWTTPTNNTGGSNYGTSRAPGNKPAGTANNFSSPDL
jgi:hypothetical protein